MMDYLRKRGSAAARLLLLSAGTVTAVSCGDDPVSRPTEGAIKVTTTTTGTDFDGNGYTVSVNSGSPTVIENFGTLFVNDLEGGTYQVRLGGLAANCITPAAENPQTVVVIPADTVDADFVVTCDIPDSPGGGDPTP